MAARISARVDCWSVIRWFSSANTVSDSLMQLEEKVEVRRHVLALVDQEVAPFGHCRGISDDLIQASAPVELPGARFWWG